MKSLKLKVSLKFGLILACINLISGLIYTFAFNPDNLSQSNFAVLGIIVFILMIVCIAEAHFEFNNKNEDYLSFKDAIYIGLIVIGVSFIISAIYNFISYEYVMKEKMAIFYSNQNESYGTSDERVFTYGTIIFTSIRSLFYQIIFLFFIITIESLWKIYKKAGKNKWASIIPLYNTIVMLDIVKKPLWWLLMLLIPGVNLIFAIWMTNLLSKRFGKDEGFTIGLIFLPFIFYPLLGLSKAKYITSDEEHPDSAVNDEDPKENQYEFIEIGEQKWMNKNLSETRFCNGDKILNAKSPKEWEKAMKEYMPAYCCFDNNIKNGEKYGLIYNWFAVSDIRGICPQGCHIPTIGEFEDLKVNVNNNGNSLKAEGTGTYDDAGNGVGTNDTGFSSLPAGYRNQKGVFNGMGSYAGFWSISAENNSAWRLLMDYSFKNMSLNTEVKGFGYSVRCLKD